MSYLDAIEDAAVYFDAISAQEEAQQAAENAYVLDFIKSCQKLDANALAGFAPMTADLEAVRAGHRSPGSPIPLRMQTLAEVMSGSLDIGNGPCTTEVMQLILSLAFSADCQANQSHRARRLLASMATAYASANVAIDGKDA